MSVLVFGSINVDHVMRVERISRPGETNMARDVQIFFGGKGANQAVAAARSGSKGLVTMAGVIGEDALADDVITNFTQNGVAIDHIVRSKTRTGTAYVFVGPDGENAITVVAGANGDICSASVSDEVLIGTTHLVLQMEIPIGEVRALAERYKAINTDGTVILNLAPVPSASLKTELTALLALTDILIVNEHELLRTSEILRLSSDADAKQSARRIADVSGATVVVTLGEKGAIATGHDWDLIEVPPTPITPIDTTGAGDTFAGVLASSLAENLSLPESLNRASRAGALACLEIGAQAGMPSAVELENIG